ncbi:hypothetical protein DAPPUDRAFT_115324 [Daphnia pulex]|uniref:Uncharacterized protein n=1 Tax=Daphnia pulex TaxID=6669 RepID=E9HL02_DAPPU|nr:hypothetical protein DAPPUDRAFT_115324 [Daphnia pulex]|eukprot:EFX67582.1 hypothetical protein DAPPUDRAFT_115324 [Daphnia pulex]
MGKLGKNEKNGKNKKNQGKMRKPRKCREKRFSRLSHFSRIALAKRVGNPSGLAKCHFAAQFKKAPGPDVFVIEPDERWANAVGRPLLKLCQLSGIVYTSAARFSSVSGPGIWREFSDVKRLPLLIVDCVSWLDVLRDTNQQKKMMPRRIHHQELCKWWSPIESKLRDDATSTLFLGYKDGVAPSKNYRKQTTSPLSNNACHKQPEEKLDDRTTSDVNSVGEVERMVWNTQPKEQEVYHAPITIPLYFPIGILSKLDPTNPPVDIR